MRYSSTTGMMLAALSIGEAMAGPTHAHLHRHVREKKDVDWSALDWDDMGINWSSAYEAGQAAKTATAAAAPVTTTAAAAIAATTTAASSSIASAVEGLWDDLVGAANDLTSFGQSTPSSGSEVSYIGNIGYPIEGSNMIKVSTRTGYDFTSEFINTSGDSMTVVIWNKAASQKMADPLAAEANLGSCIAPEYAALTFALASGASQIVAFAENTQIGFAQATDSKAESGAFATTWGECNFLSTGSGYDVSAIMNTSNDYNMSISASEAPDCVSDMTQNMWLTASDPVGTSDGSCYIAQSTATLTVKMGGTV